MNIQILDSWLREHLKTRATVNQVAEILSLTSVSVDKVEKIKNDHLYHIEITNNRVDLMSILGLAREAAATISQFGIEANFIPLNIEKKLLFPKKKLPLVIENDLTIVNRICAVILEVELKRSPIFIQERLESMGIRSINNLVDITNYVMREVGHPCHVFDYDKITSNKIVIRKAKPGEKIITLDEKEHVLKGNDIIADNGKGELIDLLGIMGGLNSIVDDKTKRIILFIDNNKAINIRRTSMGLNIRTEAAVLNEKGVDRELAMDALLRGIKLYEEFANATPLSDVIDIYPNKLKSTSIKITDKKINNLIGTNINLSESLKILKKLDFDVIQKNNELIVTPPSFRREDVTIPEDLVEEIARIYGYDKLPALIPPLNNMDEKTINQDEFFWQNRFKNALKYWGFVEVYTYSMISEDLYEGPIDSAIEITNPLNDDLIYMRKLLVPSLLKITRDNSSRKEIKIFEIAKVYRKNDKKLPSEFLHIAGVIKKQNLSFFEVKGIIEQLLADSGINDLKFKESDTEANGISIFKDKDYFGEIQILEADLINFEMNFSMILKHANLKKNYKPLGKYPSIIEDLAIIASDNVNTLDLIKEIKKQSELIEKVTLLDQYKETRTFHIIYRHFERSLNNKEVGEIRKKILSSLSKNFAAHLKN